MPEQDRSCPDGGGAEGQDRAVLTVHGLRRTFITIGRKLKIFEDTDRLTNHIDSSVTGKHYDGTEVDDLREPLQRIANEIERLMVHGVGAKIIAIGTGKQAA